MSNAIEVHRSGGFLEVLGHSVKALGPKRKVPFGNFTTGAYGNGYSNGYGAAGGLSWGTQPGAARDYRSEAGNLLENRIVAAGVNAIAQALASAPPILEKKKGDGWEKVEQHDCIDLLNQPNDNYGSAHLWAATAGSEVTDGESFWRMEKTRAGFPSEIWWENASRFRVEGNAQEFISDYVFTSESGAIVRLDNDDVIHFRHSLNPYNPRRGWSPLQSGYRQVSLDNGIASYQSSILRNSGVPSIFVAPKDGETAANVDPGKLEQFIALIKQRLANEGAGSIIGSSLPLELHKMGYSPDEMSVDKLVAYAEAAICALIGVDPMVLGLGSGTQQKTYANMAEALNDFWERRIIPTKQRHSNELGAQYLPLWGLDPAEYRIAWDYSGVQALQENETELSGKVTNEYKLGIIDRATAKTKLHYETSDADKDVYASGGAGAQEAAPPVAGAPPKLQMVGAKALPELPESTLDFDQTQAMKNTDEEEMPAPLPDPHGMAFTDDELEALTDVDSEEAIKLAFGLSSPEKRALLSAKEVER